MKFLLSVIVILEMFSSLLLVLVIVIFEVDVSPNFTNPKSILSGYTVNVIVSGYEFLSLGSVPLAISSLFVNPSPSLSSSASAGSYGFKPYFLSSISDIPSLSLSGSTASINPSLSVSLPFAYSILSGIPLASVSREYGSIPYIASSSVSIPSLSSSPKKIVLFSGSAS